MDFELQWVYSFAIHAYHFYTALEVTIVNSIPQKSAKRQVGNWHSLIEVLESPEASNNLTHPPSSLPTVGPQKRL